MTAIYFVTHYFFPSHSNNHKAKIIHTSSLLFLSLFLLLYQILLHSAPLAGIKILGYAANIPPDEIIRLTNQKRAEAGQPALQYSSILANAANSKGAHMLENDYWAHVAPDGTEPWKFFTDVGYKYKYAGENLARDFSNPNDVIEAWVTSPSHKENMLSSKYKEIGIAVVEGDLNGVDTTIIVQFFGTKLVDTTPQIPVAVAKPEVTSIPISPTKPIPTLISTPIPTSAPFIALVSLQPSISEQKLIVETSPTMEKASGLKILISPFQSTKSISIMTTALLLLVMVTDGIIVSRRKIPRIGGRTFAHLAFLGMILAILLIARAGKIL